MELNGLVAGLLDVDPGGYAHTAEGRLGAEANANPAGGVDPANRKALALHPKLRPAGGKLGRRLCLGPGDGPIRVDQIRKLRKQRGAIGRIGYWGFTLQQIGFLRGRGRNTFAPLFEADPRRFRFRNFGVKQAHLFIGFEAKHRRGRASGNLPAHISDHQAILVSALGQANAIHIDVQALEHLAQAFAFVRLKDI